MAICISGIFICIFFSIIGKIKNKTIFNPMTLFCGEWALILLLSILHLYTLYLPNDKTYLLILEGIIAFIIGQYVFKLFFNNIKIKVKKNSGNFKIQYKLRYNLVYIVILICCFDYLFDLINIIKVVGLSGYSLKNIQQTLQFGQNEVNNSVLKSIILLFIIQPASIALPAITAADFWFGKKNKKLLIGTTIMLLLKMLSTANRTSIMCFLMYFIICGICSIKFNKNEVKYIIKKNNKKKIKFVLGIGLLLFIAMSISRGAKIYRNLYLNFAMPPIMFEKWMDPVDSKNLLGYGTASLNGFLYPVILIFSKILGAMPENFKNVYDFIIHTDKNWIWIGDKITANAYVSVFWFLYLDARKVGIVVGMFILSVFCAINFKKIKRDFCARNIAVYMLVIYMLIFSYVRIQFALTWYALAYLYTKIFVYRKQYESDAEE